MYLETQRDMMQMVTHTYHTADMENQLLFKI